VGNRHRVYRSIAALLVLGLSITWPAGRTQAGPSTVGVPAGRAAAAHQITLSLSLPGTAYPLDALVPVTLTLRNGTIHAVSTWDCLEASLLAQAVGSNGRPHYPPLLPPPGAPFAYCPGRGHSRRGVELAPGRRLVRHQYVMLRTPIVRGHAEIQTEPNQQKPVSIDTPLSPIRRVRGAGPTLVLHRKPVSATVSPVPGGGPLLVSEYVHCTGRSTDRYGLSAVRGHWNTAAGTTLRPLNGLRCPAVKEWHLFVAQVGRPVARIDYCGGRGCAYPSRRSFPYFP
jgi:hypothetical protein